MQAYDNDNNFYEEKINEDIFTTLLKKETSLNNIFLNAVYLKNSFRGTQGSYYIYFYNKINNTCYINDLNFYGSLERLSVTNTIEQLSIKILPYIQAIQERNISQTEFEIPKFIYFHNRGYGSREIVKQIVELKPLYNDRGDISGFCEPNWKQGSEILKPIDDSMNKSKRNSKTKIVKR